MNQISWIRSKQTFTINGLLYRIPTDIPRSDAIPVAIAEAIPDSDSNFITDSYPKAYWKYRSIHISLY